MAYEYNKKFFRDWFEREKIKKKDLLQVIQTSSANNLQIWLLEREPTPLKEGQTDTGDRDWLPLRCILRLCNHYGLKISNFIINAEEPAPQKGRKDNRQQLEIAAMKNELLQAKLDHQEEINAIHAKYLEREDRIRKLVHENGTTLLFVSHSIAQVESLCEKALWIERGKMRMAGTAADVCSAYKAMGA